jgi:Ssp1 endopeptidase immunity protein Rap1a
MRTTAIGTILLLCTLVCSSMPAIAQVSVFRSGKDLHEALQKDGSEYSGALNYVIGVVDAANGAPAKDGFCFRLGPEAVPASRIVEVVKAFVSKNNQMWDRPGSTLVAAALQESWPCR